MENTNVQLNPTLSSPLENDNILQSIAPLTQFPTLVSPLEDTIYALRRRWVENTIPKSEMPSFGNGHYTFDLIWYRHKGYADGSISWEGGRQVGNDWVFSQIVPGPHGKLYAVEGDGDLMWYDHLGSVDGTPHWAGPRDVGDGWSVPTINPSPQSLVGIFCDTRNGDNLLSFSSPGSIIYAIKFDGGLYWYRHEGDSDGTFNWVNGGLPKTVGSGWKEGQKRVFSGSNGVIYLIGQDGTLSWYKHRGYRDGSFDWEGPTRIGQGWNSFHNVFSIGRGIIYAIDQDGTLWWYKHKGYRNGANDWEDRKRVGVGWNADGFDVVCNSVDLTRPVTFLH